MNSSVNTNINLTHVPEQTDLAETLYDKRIISEYDFSFEYLYIKPDSIHEFLNELIKNFDVKIKKYKFTKALVYYIYHRLFFVNLTLSNRNINVSFYTKDSETLDKLYNIYLKYEDKSADEAFIKLTNYTMTPQGIGATQRTLKYDFFENINEKFYPFLDVDLFMKEFIYGKENILILCGKPGTGKSKFANLIMKKLIENPEFNDYFAESNVDNTIKEIFNEISNDIVYYVASAKDVNMIATDQFWNKVKNQDLVILDDLDFLLSSRKENREDVIKNQFLSHLLSFTDGIEDNRTKIIITTNQPFESIDEALLRRGRLFGILEFRPLTYEEALDIWIDENLDKKIFEKIFKNYNEITHAELGEAIQNTKRNKKYIAKKDYILDLSIDALRKAEKRRAGLV